MTADHHPRYVVRELTGYPMKTGSNVQSTDVWVADTWNCWREVARFMAPAFYGDHRPRVGTRRAMEEAVCNRLNAEHDAWLAEVAA